MTDVGAWKAQIDLDPKALQMIFEDIAHAHEGF